jgi:hypothetical protein
MKKSLVTLLLVFATVAVAQQAPADPQAAQQNAGQPSTSSQKTFKDPAESNAFYAAYNTQDPAARATALESFLQSYPNSIAKQDALEILLKTYQQVNNPQKMQDTAKALLQIDAHNLTALAVLTYLNLSSGQQTGNLPMLAQAAQYGQTGLQAIATAKTPEGVPAADWEKQKKTFSMIFENAIGINGLATKDYPTAQKALTAVVTAQPDDVNSVFSLAQSQLEQKPIVIDGLFWGARAVALAKEKGAPQTAVDQIQKYVRYKYVRYHGTEQGFPELLAAAATTPALPQGFTVAPAPSPADQAAEMIKGKQPKDLSFGEWEFILTSGNQQATDFVWNAPDGIKGKVLAMQGWVATASPKSFSIFGTEDAKTANKPDIILNLTEAVTAARLPKPGTLISFQGTPDSYVATPDFVMTMIDGYVKLPNAPATKAPAKKGTGAKKK